MEKLEEERKAISGDIRDMYSEAKGVGYDVKTMRRIVQLRKQDVAERDEEEQLLDVYAHALGMVFNSADTHDIVQKGQHPRTEGELMDYASRIVREVDLCATHLVSMDGSPPKIEAIKGLIGCSAGKASKLRTLVIERLEQISRSIAFHRENEIPQTADGNPPGESSRLANPIPEVPAGEEAGNTGGDHDAGLTTLAEEVARAVPPPAMISPDINTLLASAKPKVDALSPAERDAMLKAQAASFARAEMAFGSDEQEAAVEDVKSPVTAKTALFRCKRHLLKTLYELDVRIVK